MSELKVLLFSKLQNTFDRELESLIVYIFLHWSVHQSYHSRKIDSRTDPLDMYQPEYDHHVCKSTWWKRSVPKITIKNILLKTLTKLA